MAVSARRSRRGDDATSQLTAALQAYADRGVFRGLRVEPGPGGRSDYFFTWLTPTPMRLRYERSKRELRFVDLLPRVSSYSGLAEDLRRLVLEHQSSAVPEHRRIDGRRVKLATTVRAGRFSVTLRLRGAQEAYAVQRGVNLVNQLFQLLQANYPEYLIQCFGFSQE
jgi:hypothetical protein